MADVLLVGEAMAMFYADEYGTLDEVENYKKGLAGAEVNVGIGLSRLGHKVNYVTKLSRDPYGKYIYDYLEKENLGTDFVTYDEHRMTGLMMKNKVKDGDPDTVYYRKNSAASALSIEDIKQIDFSTLKLVHVTGIPPALSLTAREACKYIIDEAKKAGCHITFDPNLRPTLWESQEVMIEVLNDLAKNATTVLPGISEGEILTGSSDPQVIADFYLQHGVENVIIKAGGDGAIIFKASGERIEVPGFKIDPIVDTVGAGDGFAVGIISGILEELALVDVVLRGNAIGGIQLMDASDNEGLPTREELALFIKNNK